MGIIMDKPPAHLSHAAQKLWRRLVQEFEFDDGALIILTTCFEAYDSMKAAQKAIKRDGMVQQDRFGQLRSHPLCSVLRDSRAAFVSALKTLGVHLPEGAK
jgi:P27 family predicted phage terminase small subunit